ncbi:glycosyltransferase involved in cell wall biosynthesis [Rhodanobacter sp. MP7CTX1]|nr:glycosyltransferase involved in cell wall biosynthesis [Rhodanobacter sp. MP7CTX1]
MELLLRALPETVDAFVACPTEPPYGERFHVLTQGRVFSLPHRRFSLVSAVKLVAYARKQRVDLIHTHGKGAGLYGRIVAALTRKPCLHTPHGIHVAQYGIFAKWAYRLYENASARWVDRLVFVSAEEQNSAQNEGLWLRTASSVIVNGVDVVTDESRDLMRHAMRVSHGVNDAALIVVTLSRFDFQKNMQEAYEVAKAFPEAMFWWVGEGGESDELKLRAKAEGVGNLRFLGVLDDPTAVLAASDIYFTTSRWEGLPLAVLEAMSMGLPVVASDVTGHRELVGKSGGGELYPLGVASKAVDALRRLTMDNTLRREMGERGRNVQRKGYSTRQMTDSVVSLYRRLARNVGGQ